MLLAELGEISKGLPSALRGMRGMAEHELPAFARNRVMASKLGRMAGKPPEAHLIDETHSAKHIQYLRREGGEKARISSASGYAFPRGPASPYVKPQRDYRTAPLSSLTPEEKATRLGEARTRLKTKKRKAAEDARRAKMDEAAAQQRATAARMQAEAEEMGRRQKQADMDAEAKRRFRRSIYGTAGLAGGAGALYGGGYKMGQRKERRNAARRTR